MTHWRHRGFWRNRESQPFRSGSKRRELADVMPKQKERVISTKMLHFLVERSPREKRGYSPRRHRHCVVDTVRNSLPKKWGNNVRPSTKWGKRERERDPEWGEGFRDETLSSFWASENVTQFPVSGKNVAYTRNCLCVLLIFLSNFFSGSLCSPPNYFFIFFFSPPLSRPVPFSTGTSVPYQLNGDIAPYDCENCKNRETTDRTKYVLWFKLVYVYVCSSYVCVRF